MNIAIIGTRNPDAAQIALASAASAELSAAGHTIVTGGADGIDNVAMWRCKAGQLAVVLPWENYNKGSIPPHAHVTVYNEYQHKEWRESVDKYHPNPAALTRGPIALHARNYGIVEHCSLVLAMPGNVDGGTGQGMRVAKGLSIRLLVYHKGSTTNLTVAMEAVRIHVADVQGVTE